MNFIFKSSQMVDIIEKVSHVAKMDSSIVLYGETGVGKSLVAKYIHSISERKNAPFEEINCAAIPENLIESELFGYERGAFTGASERGKVGLLDIANEGTVFLDEIGEASYSLQSKLLKFLDSGEVMRVGGLIVHHVDCRIICATNRNIFEMVRTGNFREDLYYRLNIFPIVIPPLRERPEDIKELSRYKLDELNTKYGTEKVFSKSIDRAFQRYKWPGNIRQLNNVVERLYALSGEENTIDVSLLRFSFDDSNVLRYHNRGYYGSDTQNKNKKPLPLKKYMQEVEIQYIHQVLGKCGGSVTKAAELLGIHRTSIYKKLGNEGELLNEKD